VTFRDRIPQSLAKVQPVLEIPGVMVGGSQVPNLLQPEAASTLVVSQDVDLVIPVAAHAQVRSGGDPHPVSAEYFFVVTGA
jgi:hypothetical protein